MTIIWPSNTTEIIDEIRGAIGRDVEFFYVYSSMPCPVCSLDPITNTSTDSFCLTCSGTYWIDLYSGYTVSGHVTWSPSDILMWTTGGQYFDGDCRVQIKYTPENVTIVDQAEYVVVDDKVMEINSKILRGVKQINRILIDLKEKEKDA